MNSTLLLHPTSDDSNSLTVLEAMKAGLPIISTKLYAIPEMVKDGVNGFLTEPKYAFFDNNNLQILRCGIIEKKLYIQLNWMRI